MLKEDKRNYGIDLLRIVSMLMVCMLHILGIGGLVGEDTVEASLIPGTAQSEIALLLKAMTFGAVNCYALISGYVGVNSTGKWKSIIQLWLQVVCYSVGITIALQIWGRWDIAAYDLRAMATPVLSYTYWYFTAYFCLFFFMPYLNKCINTLHEQSAVRLIVLLLVFFSVIQTARWQIFFTKNGYCLWWLMILYVIGGCIRRTAVLQKCPKWLCLAIYLIGAVLARIIGDEMMNYIAPTILLGSMALLILFSQLRLGRMMCKITSALAPLTFGVYLIHTHPIIFEQWLRYRFAPLGQLSPGLFILGLLACTLGLFCVCSAVDAVRKLAFRWLGIDWLCDKLGNLLTRTEEKLYGGLAEK